MGQTRSAPCADRRYEKKSEFESALKYRTRDADNHFGAGTAGFSMLGKPMGWPALEYSRTDTYLADWLEGGEQDAAKSASNYTCAR